MPVTRIDLPLENLTQAVSEENLQRKINAERTRLAVQLGLEPESGAPRHFHRPDERPFTAEERGKVTILFGGLSLKHERVIHAVFRGCGYRCEILPTADVSAFQIGKEYGNNGQCNPTYFTVGNLVQHLRRLEAGGVSRKEIIDRYVFFTAGSCGPCRFGMYESEYRLALQNAGYDGFRVLLFQQDDGVKAASGETGLKFTVDFGMGMFNALNIGDIMNEMAYRVRPFEAVPGATDAAFSEAMDTLCRMLGERTPYEFADAMPSFIGKRFNTPEKQRTKFYRTANSLGKVWDHLYGEQSSAAFNAARDILSRIEVDRLKVKPVVKIIGEFWAQITEGDGNFHMFEFLEREGAQVLVEPIGTWIMYMLYQVKEKAAFRKQLDAPHKDVRWYAPHKLLLNEIAYRKKWLGFSLGETIYNRQYSRIVNALGEVAHHLIPQAELAALARPYYNQFARGGEGHLEVGKNVYYTKNRLCHMVLALKPFGCMPSSQSDAVQSAVANHFKEMIFLPIETSGEGEINAHSRVQMALGEAKFKARAEFEQALKSTGRSLDEIRTYATEHPELRSLFYTMPRRNGVTGEAANFVLHVNDLMNGKSRRARSVFPARNLAAA